MTRTWVYNHRSCALCGKVLRDGDGNYITEHKTYDWLHVCLECNEQHPGIRKNYNGTVDKNHPLNPRNDPDKNPFRRATITQLDIIEIMGWDDVDLECICKRLDIPNDGYNRNRLEKTLRRMVKVGLVEVTKTLVAEDRRKIIHTWRRI